MDLNNPHFAELLEQFKNGRSLQFRNREIILRAADEPPGVYCIGRGFVKVYSITDQGEENVHIIYKAGEIFPLTWVFKDILRNVFYESLGPSKLWRLPKDDFLALVKSSPDISYILLVQLAERFNVYADRVDNLEFTDARLRVVYRLLFLAGRFGQKQGKKILIKAPITHQHIADSINLARETVSREIEILEHKGLLTHQKRQIVLKNVKGLQEIIGEPISLDLWGLK